MSVIDGGDDDSDSRAAKLAKKLTVLDSLHMQKEAWNRVSVQTIQNCYKRASFIEENDTNQDAGLSMVSGVTVEINISVELPPGGTSDDFSRYVSVDDNLPVSADQTDAEICVVQVAAVGSLTRRAPPPDSVTLTLMNAERFKDALQSLHMFHTY